MKRIVGLMLIVGFAHSINAHEIIVGNGESNSHVIEFQSGDSFLSVMDSIRNYYVAEEVHGKTLKSSEPYTTGQSFQIDCRISDEGYFVTTAKKARTSPRNYEAPFTDDQQSDISYIVKTLANDSLISIGKKESTLKRAGDRIDDVHPFQFLGYVFSNEELIVCMRNLQGRSWVWKNFINGLIDSLKEENANNNLMPFLSDFANKILIDANIIRPYIKDAKWKELVDMLIGKVERKGEVDRYKM